MTTFTQTINGRNILKGTPEVGSTVNCSWADWTTEFPEVTFKGEYDGYAWLEWKNAEGELVQLHPKLENCVFLEPLTDDGKRIAAEYDAWINDFIFKSGISSYDARVVYELLASGLVKIPHT